MEVPLSSRVSKDTDTSHGVRWSGGSREMQFKARGGRKQKIPKDAKGGKLCRSIVDIVGIY